jgi:hypothetical protein
MLRMVYQDSNEEMHGQLWKAVRTGLISDQKILRGSSATVSRKQPIHVPQRMARRSASPNRYVASHTRRDKLEEQVFEILPVWVPFYNWPLLVSGGEAIKHLLYALIEVLDVLLGLVG